MPGTTAAALEYVNAFAIDGTVFFKHYFEGDDVFARLRLYYNGNQYRFEVPVDKFGSLRRFLSTNGYAVELVDRPEDYYVAVRQYTEHPDGIFKDAVRHEGVDDYNCFLMKDRDAVESALAGGASRLSTTRLSVQSGTLGDFAVPSA